MTFNDPVLVGVIAQARAQTPESSGPYHLLVGWCSLYAGKSREALEAFQNAILRKPSAVAYYSLGYALAVLGSPVGDMPVDHQRRISP